MAEPFKNWLNETVIVGMADHFKRNYPAFKNEQFIADATDGLVSLELKQRSDRITNMMIKYLPTEYQKTSEIILASLGTPLGDNLSSGTVDEHGISGWAVMPMTHYVGLQGHGHFDLSMTLLKEMTKCSSSEFDIRYFLIASPDKTLSVLNTWAEDNNQHVRRLVSEGSRPRLPWAMRLPQFIENPQPVIELLEKLKDDKKEYVRRSVANNLNDIAKDHPDLVADIAGKWMIDASVERQKLIRHACRTLVKNGHKQTLKVLGFNSPSISNTTIELSTHKVIFGEALCFTVSLESSITKRQPLMIDYIIHHQKANGKTSPKVFKLRTATLHANKILSISKKHSIKKITTRVYYPGLHTLEIMVNGMSMGKVDFELLMP